MRSWSTIKHMNFAYKAYNFLSTGFFLTFFPPFWFYTRLTGRYRESINQRLGSYPNALLDAITGSPRIWIHAASVGEVSAAVAIIESLALLMPGCAIILSTTTEHGQAFAREKLRSKATCIYAPIDFRLDDMFFSDVLCDEIWYFLSCKMIKEHHSDLSYKITPFGAKNADFILSSYKEKDPTSWGIFEKILEKF